jgi:hypothetical protein
MIHPLFRLAASQPLLLAEHAAAYASLLSEEVAITSAGLQRRVAFQLAGAACLMVAATLAGVALLLWAALGESGIRLPWLLGATPALPALLGAWLLRRGQARQTTDPFGMLRRQLAEDAALLRSTATP